MEIQEFKARFSQQPEKFPFQLAKRYQPLLEKLLTHWEVPIEMEALFSKIISDSANLGSNGIPQDVILDLMHLRDEYKRWRDENRPKAAPHVLASLSPNLVPDIVKKSAPPSPDVLKTMQKVSEAVMRDSPDAAKILLDSKLSIDQRDVDGLTALMTCAQRGSEKAAISLIKAGSNPHMIDIQGNTPLHWAVIQNKRRLAEMLLYFGGNPNTPNAVGATPLSLSSIKEDSTLLQRLYEYGADISTQDSQGNTPLHKAVSSGSIENVWLLLLAGAPGSARNKAGKTPREIAEKNPEVWRIWDMHQVHKNANLV